MSIPAILGPLYAYIYFKNRWDRRNEQPFVQPISVVNPQKEYTYISPRHSVKDKISNMQSFFRKLIVLWWIWVIGLVWWAWETWQLFLLWWDQVKYASTALSMKIYLFRTLWWVGFWWLSTSPPNTRMEGERILFARFGFFTLVLGATFYMLSITCMWNGESKLVINSQKTGL